MIQSKKHLARILRKPWKELVIIGKKHESYYYTKREKKLKKNGDPKLDRDGNIKYRTMYPSIGKLKKLQAIIKGGILRKVPLPDNVYGGVKGKDSVRNAREHQGKKYKFCTDLKDFFPSIKPNQVYKSLIKVGFSADVASLLTKLVTYKNQVPQGTPTSTHIANIVFLEIDEQIIDFCKEKGIKYTRYVDDLTFSSQYDFRKESLEIVKIIQESGFRISHKKTMYAAGSMVITGVRVRNNCLSVTDEMKGKLDHPEKFTSLQVQGHNAFLKRVKTA